MKQRLFQPVNTFSSISQEENFSTEILSFYIKSMQAITEAHGNHLFYPEDLYAQYDCSSAKQLETLLNLIKKSGKNSRFAFDRPAYTTNEYFDYEYDHRGAPISMTYRLRPGKSASEGLGSLLSEGKTMIDCQGGVQLTRYVVLLSLLQTKWGIQNGRNYFDALFGSNQHLIPRQQRLLISSIHPLLSLARNNNFDYQIMPMCTLAYFLKNITSLSSVDGTDVTFLGDRKLQLGCQVGFKNADLYLHKHTLLGSSPSTNVIYVGKNKNNKDTFMGLVLRQ